MKMISSFVAALLATAVSQPAVARIETATVEPVANGGLSIRWSAAELVDVYMSYSADSVIGAATLISDADGDGSHIVSSLKGRRPFFMLRDRADGTLRRVAERLLPLERGSNFRDVGGYSAAGGKHVRWGKIYRSGAMPLLSDKDYAYLDALDIDTIVDLRSVEERQIAPTLLDDRTGARYVANDYSANAIFGRLAATKPGAAPTGVGSMYREWLISLAPQYRAIFAGLLAKDGAVAYHCSAGQDRTGVGTALVLSALGVPRDVILADYHLSTPFRRTENEMPTIDAAQYPGNVVASFYAKTMATPEARKPRPLYDATGAAQLAATFDEIDRRWGSVDRYLDEVLGVDANELAALRADYLE